MGCKLSKYARFGTFSFFNTFTILFHLQSVLAGCAARTAYALDFPTSSSCARYRMSRVHLKNMSLVKTDYFTYIPCFSIRGPNRK